MRILVLSILYYGCAFVGLVNPFFGLLFLIHIIIFRPESLVWGGAYFGRLHLITAVLVIIGCFLHKRDLAKNAAYPHQKRNIALFLIFILWLGIVTVLANVSVQMSFDKTVEVIKIFAICTVFTVLVTTEKRLDLYVWVSVISFGLVSFWGFLQALAGNQRLDDLWPGGSNYVGAQLALMTPLAIAKAMDKNVRLNVKLLFLACAVSMVLCIFATESRGAFLGLSAALFTFVLFTRYRARAIIVMAFIALLSYPWILQPSVERLSTIFSSAKYEDPTIEGRVFLWKLAIEMWQDNPIAGIGLDNFSDYRKNYEGRLDRLIQSDETREIVFGGRARYPHGMYTGVLAETGIVGLALLLIVLFRNLWLPFPKYFVRDPAYSSLYLQARAAQAGLLGLAIAAIFGDFQYLEMFYLQMFFIGAVRGYAEVLISQARLTDNVPRPEMAVAARATI